MAMDASCSAMTLFLPQAVSKDHSLPILASATHNPEPSQSFFAHLHSRYRLPHVHWKQPKPHPNNPNSWLYLTHATRA
jgi:hypothetical protein